MKPWIRKSALCAALLVALPAFAQAPTSPPTGADASTDRSSATPRGTTFVLPSGWTQSATSDAVLLTPPEANGSRIVILDATGNDPDAAVTRAWKALGATPKFLVATDSAPRDGWEQRRFYSYDVAENAHRAVQAIALRRGTA